MIPTLFRLPSSRYVGITFDRLKMLDCIEYGVFPPMNQSTGRILRRLIADDLISVTVGGPATYRLTPIGRLVRSRPRKPGGRDDGKIHAGAQTE
jgi:hypothetical protein